MSGLYNFFICKSNVRTYFYISLFLHLLVALNSIGFHHPDEQYYAIDFALQKLNLLDNNSPTWEYITQIRPWLLPSIFTGLIGFLKIININDPFIVTTILRIFSAITAWACMIIFNLSYRNIFKEEKAYKLSILLTHFSWFILYMHARTSSENWATAIFLLGLSILLKKEIFKKAVTQTTPLVISGLLFGLSFSLRHQLGIMILSFGLWALITKKIPWHKWIFIFSLSIILSAFLGILNDFWGYNDITFTPYNYLKENLINNKIGQFGITPWWQYFKLITIKLTPLIGIPILLTTFLFCIKNRSHIFTWIFLPFFLFHCLIGHKELRFLFPLIPVVLVITSLFFEKPISIIYKKIIFIPALIINILLVLFISFKAAYTPLLFYKKLWGLSYSASNSDFNLTVLKDHKGHYPNLELKYYLRPNLKIIKSTSINTNYVMTTKYYDLQILRDNRNCEIEYLSYPQWILKYNFFGWVARSNIWALSKCNQNQ